MHEDGGNTTTYSQTPTASLSASNVRQPTVAVQTSSQPNNRDATHHSHSSSSYRPALRSQAPHTPPWTPVNHSTLASRGMAGSSTRGPQVGLAPTPSSQPMFDRHGATSTPPARERRPQPANSKPSKCNAHDTLRRAHPKSGFLHAGRIVHHYIRSLQGIESTVHVQSDLHAAPRVSPLQDHPSSLPNVGPVISSFLQAFGYTDRAIVTILKALDSADSRDSFAEGLSQLGLPVLEARWIFDNADC